MYKSKKAFLILIVLAAFSFGLKNVSAENSQDSASVLYVPLIGISLAPEPLSLPNGPGNVTYHYAVKNFLREVPLTDVQVVDDKCSLVKFIEGDDNSDSKLDYDETWRYTCSTNLSVTTESVATATGTANNLTATHKAYATVIVGSSNPAPMVSIVNVTKVAYPLSLQEGGGNMTFTYKVNNPGIVPLSDVIVTDDKCNAMSGKLGDTNGNNLLDTNEVWIYTCTTTLRETTTSTVSVSAMANGLEASDQATLTINVDASSSPNLFDVAISPGTVNPNFKLAIWEILGGVLAALIVLLVLKRGKNNEDKK